MIFVYMLFSSLYLISFCLRMKIPQNALNVTAGFFLTEWKKRYAEMNSTGFLLSEKHRINFVCFWSIQLAMFTLDKNRQQFYTFLLLTLQFVYEMKKTLSWIFMVVCQNVCLVTTQEVWTLETNNGLMYEPHPQFWAKNLSKKVRFIHKSLQLLAIKKSL